jgi:TRAP-type C4-dicarboxylate transport system permease small subunit
MILKRLVRWIEKAESFLAGILLGAMVASMGLQIASRVIRGKAFSWPEELGVILLIFSSFLAAGALYKREAHISVDYFVRRFIPGEKQELMARIVWLLSIAAFLVLLIGGIKGMEYAMKYTSGAVLSFPRGYLRLPLIFMCLSNIFASIMFLLSPPRETPSASSAA